MIAIYDPEVTAHAGDVELTGGTVRPVLREPPAGRKPYSRPCGAARTNNDPPPAHKMMIQDSRPSARSTMRKWSTSCGRRSTTGPERPASTETLSRSPGRSEACGE